MRRFRRVDWLPLVGDLSYESQHRVSSVGGGLDPSIRQSYHKLSLNISLQHMKIKNFSGKCILSFADKCMLSFIGNFTIIDVSYI